MKNPTKPIRNANPVICLIGLGEAGVKLVETLAMFSLEGIEAHFLLKVLVYEDRGHGGRQPKGVVLHPSRGAARYEVAHEAPLLLRPLQCRRQLRVVRIEHVALRWGICTRRGDSC